MVKSAGFLKKLKKVKDLIGTGASWINNNVVKPLRPYIDTGLDLVGAGWGKKVLNAGSNLIDYWDEKDGRKTDTKHSKYIQKGADLLLDTQRAPTERKYSNLF